MREFITEEYLRLLGCSEGADLIEQATYSEWRNIFELEGYDCRLLISPMPNGACSFDDQTGEWREHPIDDDFSIGHTGDFQIFCNGFENHIATFHYQDELEALLRLIHAPGFCPEDGPAAAAATEISNAGGAAAVRAARLAGITFEQIIECLFAEYEYWRDADSEVSIGAIGALANVIAFATLPHHRAAWHPKKTTERDEPIEPETSI